MQPTFFSSLSFSYAVLPPLPYSGSELSFNPHPANAASCSADRRQKTTVKNSRLLPNWFEPQRGEAVPETWLNELWSCWPAGGSRPHTSVWVVSDSRSSFNVSTRRTEKVTEGSRNAHPGLMTDANEGHNYHLLNGYNFKSFIAFHPRLILKMMIRVINSERQCLTFESCRTRPASNLMIPSTLIIKPLTEHPSLS